MEDRRTLYLAVGTGERRQLLLEAGSMVLVTAGEVSVGQTVDWLSGQAVRVAQRLVSEDVWVAEAAGWIEIVASRAAQLAIIPPDRISFWRQVGGYLDAWLGAATRREGGAG